MDRTITALYDTMQAAQRAKQMILDRVGEDNAHVEISSADQTSGSSPGHSSSGHEEGFMDKLKHFFMAEDDHHAYSEGMRRGGSLLTARVDESQADEVCRLLHDTDAVDLDAKQQEWASTGWQREQPALSGERAEDGERIAVAEERFKVGKREVERGTVRVRSYVEQTPVHEQVELSEERVEVDRHPADRSLSGAEADRLFQERTIEMTERGEEAVVAKEAVVTEEVGLRKEADHRTETIDDTVRRTRVDIEDGRRGDAAALGSQGDRQASGEERSFDSKDHSVAMDAEGDRARETEEERERRLRDQPGSRPIPL